MDWDRTAIEFVLWCSKHSTREFQRPPNSHIKFHYQKYTPYAWTVQFDDLGILRSGIT